MIAFSRCLRGSFTGFGRTFHKDIERLKRIFIGRMGNRSVAFSCFVYKKISSLMLQQSFFRPLAAALILSAGLAPVSAQNSVAGYTINTSTASNTAQTTYGKVAGYRENGIYTFKGIPYAQAERFSDPVAPKAWEGVRPSRSYGPTCPQEFRTTWFIDNAAFSTHWDDGYPGEDCLRVNVWTPGLADGKRRAVMVWIHGGGFATGSGQEQPAYDGASLAKKGDVVVVSLNHRLNALGFLNLSSFGPRFKHSANLGMLDIVDALKWVKANIAAFGGNPENVTIFGQSGGGRKVSTLLCMPQAKGLFQKAIVQSGSGATFMEERYSKRIGELTAARLGLTAATIEQIKKVPYADLLKAAQKAIETVKKEAAASGDADKPSIWGFSPTKDGDVLPEHAFLNGSESISKDIPMMVGTTLNEFAGFAIINNPAALKKSESEVVADLRNKYGSQTDAYVQAFHKAYPDKPAALMPLVDFKYRPQAVAQVETKVAGGSAPVWNYLFAYQSTAVDGVFTATHCMEIPYVFNNVTRCAAATDATEAAIRLGDIMSSAWLNFAKNGNPNGKGVPTWKPYTTKDKGTMVFDVNCRMRLGGFDADLLRIGK